MMALFFADDGETKLTDGDNFGGVAWLARKAGLRPKAFSMVNLVKLGAGFLAMKAEPVEDKAKMSDLTTNPAESNALNGRDMLAIFGSWEMLLANG